MTQFKNCYMNENRHLSMVKHSSHKIRNNRESTYFTEYVIICAILHVNISFPHLFQIINFTLAFKKFLEKMKEVN